MRRAVERRQSRWPRGRDRVPVMPPGVPFLIRALNDENLSFAEVARAIEHVPSVAARLLALANSAWSAPVQPVTSLEAACSRLGMRVVRSASIALAISQPFNPARCPAFDGITFWSSALLNAEATAWVAQRVWSTEVPTARTAGLLCNLGLIWLAESLPAQTGAALEAARAEPAGGLNQYLREHCGLGYDEAGALLAGAWRLPAVLRDALAQQFLDDQGSLPLSRLVRGAVCMVSSVRHGREWNEADALLEQLGLDMAGQQIGIGYLDEIRGRTLALAESLFSGR